MSAAKCKILYNYYRINGWGTGPAYSAPCTVRLIVFCVFGESISFGFDGIVQITQSRVKMGGKCVVFCIYFKFVFNSLGSKIEQVSPTLDECEPQAFYFFHISYSCCRYEHIRQAYQKQCCLIKHICEFLDHFSCLWPEGHEIKNITTS